MDREGRAPGARGGVRPGGGERLGASIREWDAEAYDRISEPQFAWGEKVLSRLSLSGDETVVDAGCGTGRLTELLCERLPRGGVVAVDRSENMLEKARARLARFGERVRFVQAALEDAPALASLEDAPADAVFSTATLHWIHDHGRAFSSLFSVLAPGGRLVLQCGGAGNLERVHAEAASLMRAEPFAPHFETFGRIWNFAGEAETRARLEGAGFEAARVWLEPAPARFEGEAAYAEFLEKVVLATHLAALPEPLRRSFLDGVVRLGLEGLPSAPRPAEERLVLDYVRLNVDARRPPA